MSNPKTKEKKPIRSSSYNLHYKLNLERMYHEPPSKQIGIKAWYPPPHTQNSDYWPKSPEESPDLSEIIFKMQNYASRFKNSE